MESPPFLYMNPPDDAEFTLEVHRLAPASSGPADLQQRLAIRYPRVIVHAREIEGLSQRWYVYRDGMWVSPSKAP